MADHRVFRIQNDKARLRASIEKPPLQEPAEGEILIRSRYSSVNYKNALAGTGKSRFLRRFPLTGGVGHGRGGSRQL